MTTAEELVSNLEMAVGELEARVRELEAERAPLDSSDRPLGVYLSAPYPDQERMRRLAAAAATYGAVPFRVVSHWIYSRVPADIELTDLDKLHIASADLADLKVADLLVAYPPADPARPGSGGRHVEFGYALAKGIPVYTVGDHGDNVFYALGTKVVSLEHALLLEAQRRLQEVA